ncbi:Diacylglycerol acyltransferase/mycolyltransferase Ag85C [Pontiella desulfatans]|uniref:Diacylglycerol acyltransferase/mycolyltransferase Ag85C n=1 Tax=Pontiella desulfatans TaxID=2750659 RepID=A0A6C2U571_PONDE|nr:alpha/beta hydrolase family protein [Pontiella desulfatans]VGO15212.1 Diacylglycerol acyltransferase/mycolyltransferase Ag85C [Pontiella desulfatans]
MALLETNFDSQVLGLSLGANLILPEHPEAWKEPPAVLYLLHGLSDDNTIWCRRTSIERYANRYNLAIVMPDAYKSFYCDMHHGSNYWEFFSEELPMLVKRWFKVSDDPKKTFVAGISMGGYGAFKLALNCPGQYAAAASLSGALDLASHINDEWDDCRRRTFQAVFGAMQNIPGSGNDLIHQLKNLDGIPDTKFYACCGTEDFLYQDSLTFRDLAAEKGLRLTYEESAADHKWDYWDASIQRVLEWLPIENLSQP